MPGAEAIGVALKIAGLGLNNLNFFIAICAAFGGWMMTAKRLPPAMGRWRFVMTVIFVVASGSIALGTVGLVDRASLALQVAEEQIREEDIEGKQALLKLVSTNACLPSREICMVIGSPGAFTPWALAIVLVAMAVFILVFPAPKSEAEGDQKPDG